MNTRYFYRK